MKITKKITAVHTTLNSSQPVEPNDYKVDAAALIPMQEASIDIWEKKYQLKDQYGSPVDESIVDTYERVARTLSDVEEPNKRDEWYNKFLWALKNGAIPAGRILSNAGAEDHKPATSTINCTVSGTIEDSMEGILERVKEAGLTLKAGCGIGYEFSSLRPKGAYVHGAGASTSGPLSFMDIYDKMCFTISSAGGRRGAQMATFDVSHPDVLDFIQAKREDGRLRQFNLSLLITKDFMEAVKGAHNWRMHFEEGDWVEMPARDIWDAIMRSTYDFAEPGFILIDEVNRMNNNWWCENIRATNPCGEQPLPPYGSCLLGSINLTRFVLDPFTDDARFDWEKYAKVVQVFTRMLDNVVEIHGLPLEEQAKEIKRKRRHGMGFLGLGSAMAMMGMHYGSKVSVEFTEDVSRTMALEGWATGVELAKEKGAAPIMHEEFVIDGEMVEQRPEMLEDGYRIGGKIQGKILLAYYSRYMKRLADHEPHLIEAIAEHGSRFTHHTSIAPTGTISLSLANNASNGIEPSFAHKYSRNIIRAGRKTKEKVDVYSFESLAYREIVGTKEELPLCFVTTNDITPKEHIDIQAAAQKWMDSSISKTINVPTDFPYEEFKDTYLYAYEKGLKGCTTFRFNPEAFQGVLVKEEDLANTVYTFTLEDGNVIECKGNETIEYDGETHTAANLYDALKEGYYGKF